MHQRRKLTQTVSTHWLVQLQPEAIIFGEKKVQKALDLINRLHEKTKQDKTLPIDNINWMWTLCLCLGLYSWIKYSDNQNIHLLDKDKPYILNDQIRKKNVLLNIIPVL